MAKQRMVVEFDRLGGLVGTVDYTRHPAPRIRRLAPVPCAVRGKAV